MLLVMFLFVMGVLRVWQLMLGLCLYVGQGRCRCRSTHWHNSKLADWIRRRVLCHILKGHSAAMEVAEWAYSFDYEYSLV